MNLYPDYLNKWNNQPVKPKDIDELIALIDFRHISKEYAKMQMKPPSIAIAEVAKNKNLFVELDKKRPFK